MRPALLIPVKDLGNAKQRLGEAFDQPHRTQLAEAMLRDVLTAAVAVAADLDVFLVTGDERATALARAFDCGVIEDQRNESETAAIAMATEWCRERNYDTTMVIPGDIPLVTADELQTVLFAAPDEGVVIVPAYDRRGSNCILRRPADLIPLRFGNDSFLPHCESAKAIGKPLAVLELPGIALDIDHPHELELLLNRPGDTHAQRVLRSWKFDSSRTAAGNVVQ